jgi:hypothetical protein
MIILNPLTGQLVTIERPKPRPTLWRSSSADAGSSEPVICQ